LSLCDENCQSRRRAAALEKSRIAAADQAAMRHCEIKGIIVKAKTPKTPKTPIAAFGAHKG
jgi:hypothetical protein